MQRGNFLTNLPNAAEEEVIETVTQMAGGNVRIERIVTEGQATPGGEWYDQQGDEWVMVLKGGAELEFADPAGAEVLGEGDWMYIPAHRKHRVRSAEFGTLWLAVHAKG